MKKLSVNIKEPCHEKWDAMTQKEKGKFCGSCQKTVIDFTSMSDRQIADFFKKPAGSVCGRFYQDQLQRPMEIPKKRIPWVKYFFHIAWPAFVLFLKGCGQRENIMGEIAMQKTLDKKSNEIQRATVGFVTPEIIPVDSSYINPNVEIVETQCPGVGITSIEQPPPVLMGDTIAMPIEHTEVLKEEIKEVWAMDTVNIMGYETYSCRTMIAGGVSVVRTKEIQDNSEIKSNDLIEDVNLSAYPNPARAGSQITMVASPNSIIKQLQLFSSSGAMITTTQINSQHGSAKFNVPATVTPGSYFLRIVLQDEKIKTAKIIITN